MTQTRYKRYSYFGILLYCNTYRNIIYYYAFIIILYSLRIVPSHKRQLIWKRSAAMVLYENDNMFMYLHVLVTLYIPIRVIYAMPILCILGAAVKMTDFFFL